MNIDLMYKNNKFSDVFLLLLKEIHKNKSIHPKERRSRKSINLMIGRGQK